MDRGACATGWEEDKNFDPKPDTGNAVVGSQKEDKMRTETSYETLSVFLIFSSSEILM